MIIDEVIQDVDDGMEGKNTGLSMGYSRLVDFVPNVQRKTMYLIGGETASGKSAFAMDSFVYNPYEDWVANYKDKGVKLKIFIWSMEINRNIMMAKGICRRLYMKYGILTDVNYILSRGDKRASADIRAKIEEVREYFTDFEDRVTILRSDNPTGIRNTIRNYMLVNGKEIYKKIKITKKKFDTETNQEETYEEEKEVFDKYVPNDEHLYVIGIFDHVGLLKGERGFGKKARIDKLIEYMIDYRDRYGITAVPVQQLNRNMSSADRFKIGTVEPQLSDFKETADTTDGADFVFALFNPQRYEIWKHRGYDVKKLQDRYRSLKLLKTRDGVADKLIGLKFIGEIGKFSELPKAEDMTDQNYNDIMNIKKDF